MVLSAGATVPRLWEVVGNIVTGKAASLPSDYPGREFIPSVDDSYQRFLWPLVVDNENIDFVELTPDGKSIARTLSESEYKNYDIAVKCENLRLVANVSLRSQALHGSLPVRMDLLESVQLLLSILNIHIAWNQY